LPELSHRFFIPTDVILMALVVFSDAVTKSCCLSGTSRPKQSNSNKHYSTAIQLYTTKRVEQSESYLKRREE